MIDIVDFINSLQDRISLTGLIFTQMKHGCRIRDLYSGNCIYIRAVPECPEYFPVRPTPRDGFVLLRPDEIREMLLTGNYPDWWTLETRALEAKRLKRKQKRKPS